MNSEGSLDKVFWILIGSIEQWAVNPNNQPVFYDTSHGTKLTTNKYGLKFGAFTSIDMNGQTIILPACSLLNKETEESFSWIFNEFVTAFRTPPYVIFTDGDPGMSVSIRNVLPTTKHLLCTYHLSKNLTTHIKPLFCNRDEQHSVNWKNFCELWWHICKKQDGNSYSNFEFEWNQLIKMVDSIKGDAQVIGKGYDAASKWLETLYQRRKQWAARWTWCHFTLGAHSTQRAESVHATIKHLNTHS